MTDRPIVDRLLGPEEPELGCDECFEYLDGYVEADNWTARYEKRLLDLYAQFTPKAAA